MAKSGYHYLYVFVFIVVVGSSIGDIVAKRFFGKKGGIAEVVVPVEVIPEAFKEPEPKPIIVITQEDSYLDPRELLTKVFSSYVGVLEIGGNNRGPEVETFLKSVGLGPTHPWCSAFVAYCLTMAGIEHQVNAFSPTCCPKDRAYYQFSRKDPLPVNVPSGEVFALYYSDLGRIGHTGFIEDWQGNDKYCVTVEGNTSSSSGSREGDGVFRMKRRKDKLYRIATWIPE